MQHTFESSVPSVLSSSSINSLFFNEFFCSGVSKVCHNLPFTKLAGSTNTSSGTLQKLSLLPNRTNYQHQHHLHLLVHGSRGGEIHSSLISLVDQLKRYKNRSVSIEALTQDNPPQIDIGTKSMVLVPLFLLPGSHVCTDVPKIFDRFKEDGQKIKLFPFLGSFEPWLLLIGNWIINQNSIDKPALIHHPVSSETSSVFLKSLEKFLNIPLYSWSRWNREIFKSEKNYCPIPYLLTPNKNVEIDTKGDELKSLLEIEIIHQGLVNLLGNLP
tara:strand:- start:200 stop:1012 length:813 start_codon:yes stop_codon:yes gene_type:complete